MYISTAKTTNNPTKKCAKDLSRLTDIENKLMITIQDRERRWGKIGVGNNGDTDIKNRLMNTGGG